MSVAGRAVAALKDYVADRPKPAKKEHEGLVFLTQNGLGWSLVGRDSPQPDHKGTHEAVREARGTGLSFYALRHTFYTAGEYCRDKDALEYIMGHAADGADMRPLYREETWTSRLRAIVQHVHRWVFEAGYAAQVMGSR